MELEQQKDIEQLKDDVRKILGYIENDKATGRKGLYSEVREIDKRLEKVEVIQTVNLSKKSLLFFLGAALTWIIVHLNDIGQFLKKVM